MHDERSIRKRRRLGRVLGWLGAALLVVAVLQSVQLKDTDEDSPRSEQPAVNPADLHTIRVKTVDLDPAEVNRSAVERADFELVAGETTSLVAADLPAGRPLVLDLLLPAALPSAAGLSARIVALNGSRELDLTGALAATDRDRARVEIDRAWLTAGDYRIEIARAEPSERAPWRYRLEVR